MGRLIYVTGGARSGKSSYAENYVNNSGRKKRIYIATAIPFDEEMKARVAKHQKDRGENWETLEGYRNLVERLKDKELEGAIVLLDCMTNLVTNLMIMDREADWDNMKNDEIRAVEDEIKKEVTELLEYLTKSSADTVVVSNELGMGIVPVSALGRYFRDIAGRMNQLTALKSDEAYLIVSGLPVKLK